MKTLTAYVSYMGQGSLGFRFYIETHPGWLELLLTRINFYDLKHVRATVTV